MIANERLTQAADIASRVEWSPCCAPGQRPETLIVDQVLRLAAIEPGAGDGAGLSLVETRLALTECGRENLRLRGELDVAHATVADLRTRRSTGGPAPTAGTSDVWDTPPLAGHDG